MTHDKSLKEETKYRVRITDNFNGVCYCRYRWHAEETLPKSGWRDFDSGCALTFWGAKWVANRKVNKQINGRENRKEWIFTK